MLRHLAEFFAGQKIDVVQWPLGPAEERIPGLAVARIAAGARLPALWTYVSLGCWGATQHGGHGLEFAMTSSVDDDRITELVTMNAYYHAGTETQRLDVGHTVPIGEAWLNGSECDHLLVSIPYPYGPDLEICAWRGGHARILWLIPITERERQFKMQHGLEALEQRFEAESLKYWDSARASIV